MGSNKLLEQKNQDQRLVSNKLSEQHNQDQRLVSSKLSEQHNQDQRLVSNNRLVELRPKHHAPRLVGEMVSLFQSRIKKSRQDGKLED